LAARGMTTINVLSDGSPIGDAGADCGHRRWHRCRPSGWPAAHAVTMEKSR
jgi:hypothetical protein